MSRRFVVISDLHAHPWSAFAKGDGPQNSRLRRTLQVLDDSLRRAHEEGIPWLFAGDLVHTAGYALNAVLAGVAEVLSRWPDVSKVAVWGNHDARGIGGKIELDHTVFGALIRAVPNLTVLDPSGEGRVGSNACVPCVTLGGATVVGAGYQPRADLLDLSHQGDIGVYHQTVRGSVSPHGFALEEGVDAAALMGSCRVAIVGHVHHPQQIDAAPGRAVLIPGSPEHHNFGDRGEHGWWVLTLPEGSGQDPEVEFIPGGSPEFRTVDSPDEVKGGDGHFYRVRSVPAGAALPENAAVVAPVPTVVEEREILRGVSEVEAILQAWMRESPPGEGIDRAHCLTVGRQLLEAHDPVRLRPVRLRRLTLRDFCSYEAATLHVRDGVWLVTGKGRDFPSNGAGKTTLVGEALHWLVFGRNTKGLGADEVIRWGADECSVVGEFEDGPSSLVVIRAKGRGTSSLRVEVDGEPWEAASVTEMTDKLARYLGLTPEIHQNLGYFSQEKLLLFSSATDGERKNVLADLIGLSAYQEASSAAGARAGELERQRIGTEARSTVLAQQLEEERAALARKAQERDTWEAARQAKVDAASVRLQAAQDDAAVRHVEERAAVARARARALQERQLAAVDVRRDGLQQSFFREMVRGTAARIAELEARRAAEAAALPEGEERARALASSIPQVEEHVQRATADAAAARAEAQARTREQAAAESMVRVRREEAQRAAAAHERAGAALEVGVCPTCRQPVSAEHREACLAEEKARVGAAQAQLEEAVTRAQSAAEQAQAALEAQARAEKSLADVTALHQRLLTLSRTLHGIDAAEQEARSLRAQAQGLEEVASKRAAAEVQRLRAEVERRALARVRRIDAHVQRVRAAWEQQVAALTAELRAETSRINPHEAEVNGTLERIRTLEERSREAEEAAVQLQRQAALYDYWRKAFSKQGIQSLLVEEVAALFNRNRASVFPVLTQGVYDVQFSTLSRTKAGEVRERTEFLVYQHGEQVPYGALSGGQRRRVDIGIMLVLAKSVAEWMGVPGILGVMTLDEVFGFLDDSGAEGLLEALRVVQQQIPTIFVVTHDTHLQSLFPEVIQVEQDERGVSRLA